MTSSLDTSSWVSSIARAENVRVIARFRPLNRQEETLRGTLSSSPLAGSYMQLQAQQQGDQRGACDVVRFPSGSDDSVELRVFEGVLGQIEQHIGAMPEDLAELNASLAHSYSPVPSSPTTSAAASPFASGFGGWGSMGAQGMAGNGQPAPNVPPIHHQFTFSRVFSHLSAQEDLYQDVAVPIIRDVMDGYNGTIFAYGQTGSGKTHTMMGAPSGPMQRVGSLTPRKMSLPSGPFTPGGASIMPHTQSFSSSHPLSQPPTFDLEGDVGAGIIPRAVRGLFDAMYDSSEALEYTVTVFFVEIYMERVRDLLVTDPGATNLSVREDPKSNSFYVEGCVTPVVSSPEEVLQLLRYGIQNRATASTKMNAISSRSHCILSIGIHAHDTEKREHRTSKLFLVDLAGSEKVAKTKAQGQQLEEAKLINRSLAALGMVINVLSSRQSSASLHVPYRDSKLTKILMDSVGGNARTSLIVCCSPSVRNTLETLSTLRFGQRAKTIKNRAVVNREYTAEELRVQLDAARREIDALRRATSTVITGSGSPAGSTLSLPSPRTAADLALAEARFETERNALVATVHQLEDAQREAQDGLAAAAGRELRHEALVQTLREEINRWEVEFALVSRQHKEALRQRNALEAQCNVERDCVSVLLTTLASRKDEVGRLRLIAEKALRQLQSDMNTAVKNLQSGSATQRPSAGSPSGAHTSPKGVGAPPLHSPAQSSSTRTVVAVGAAAEPLSGAPSPIAAATNGHSPQSRARSPADADEDPYHISLLQGRLALATHQRDVSSSALAEALDENTALGLEIEILNRRVEVQTGRIEFLRESLGQAEGFVKEARRRQKEETAVLKGRLIEAWADATYWRTQCLELRAEAERVAGGTVLPPAAVALAAAQQHQLSLSGTFTLPISPGSGSGPGSGVFGQPVVRGRSGRGASGTPTERDLFASYNPHHHRSSSGPHSDASPGGSSSNRPPALSMSALLQREDAAKGVCHTAPFRDDSF